MKFSAKLASIWRMVGKIWMCMYRIVEKSGCCCLGMKIRMAKAVGVETERKKQIIVDNQRNLKAANFIYMNLCMHCCKTLRLKT